MGARQRIGTEELDRIALAAGYTDINQFLADVSDMALGLKQAADDKLAGRIDAWGFCAHYKNFSVTFRELMQSSGW